MRGETLELQRRPSVARFLFGGPSVEGHWVIIVLRDDGLRRGDKSDLEPLTS